jgi:hypothetical protein
VTFVWMNGSGESMERSTCDSAAKLTIGVDRVVGEELRDERGVADVAVGENVARVAGEVGEVRRVAGVGEGVEVDELCERGALFGEALADEIGADEAAAAGD